MTRLIKAIVILLMVMVMVGSSACSVEKQASSQPRAVISKGDITVRVSGTGKAIYANDIKLGFDTAGKIKILTAIKGETVTKGTILAKLDTDNLELALLQAKVNEAQALKSVTQAEIAVGQAEIAVKQAGINLSQTQSAKIQAESAITVAQFDLDKIQAVSDIKDKIMALQIAIGTARENQRFANASGDTSSFSYLNQRLGELNAELDSKNADLQKLLGKDENSGVAPYEIMIYDPFTETYSMGGQTYNRLLVEDIQIKEHQLEIARTGVEEAKQRIEQAIQNVAVLEQNVVLSNETVKQAKLASEQASKAVEVAQNQLSHATITAPFDGIITTVDVKQGDYIVSPGLSAGTPIYMVDAKSLEIRSRIDEIDIAGIKTGQKAAISLEALSNKKFDGIVTSVSTIPITTSSNSGLVEYEVTIGFDGVPPDQIKSGMSANAEIITAEKNDVLLVPNKSIKQNSQGQKFVDILINQKIQEQSIILGITDGTQTELIGGIKEGDIVIRYP